MKKQICPRIYIRALLAVLTSSGALGVAQTTTRNTDSAAAGHVTEQQWPTFLLLIRGFVFSLPGLGWDAHVVRRRMLTLCKQFSICALVLALLSASTPAYAQNSCSSTG